MTSFCLLSQPLQIDSSFTTGTLIPGSRVVETIVMPDGKVLIVGSFSTYNGVAANQIAMLNSDGSLYTAFISSPGPSGGNIVDADIDDLGRIYLVGNFTYYNNVQRKGIVRLLADGSVDSSFNPSSQLPANRFPDLKTISVRQDGKIFFGGEYAISNGGELVSINSDGTLNNTFPSIYFGFGSEVNQIVFQPDNKVLVAGWPNWNGLRPLTRFNNDGSVDTEFTALNSVRGKGLTACLRQDGKILIGGLLNKSIDDSTIFYLLCLNSDGSIDQSFSTYGFSTGQQNGTNIFDIIPFGSGYLLSGLIPSYSGVAQKNITHIDSNGNLVPGFDLGTGFVFSNVSLSDIDVSNGSLFVSGAFNSYNGVSVRGIVKLMPGVLGESDTEFDSQVKIVSKNGAIDVYISGEIIRSIDIYDLSGRLIKSSISITANGVASIEDLDVGIYSCIVTTDSSTVRRNVIVK